MHFFVLHQPRLHKVLAGHFAAEHCAERCSAAVRSEHVHRETVCRSAGVHIAPGEEGVLSGLGALQPYLIGAVENLSLVLQQRAIADLNNWLVGAPWRPTHSLSKYPE